MRIEYIMPDRSGDHVFARRLDAEDFTLSDSSRLGGVAIKPFVSQPRALNPDGTPDLSIFAFEPKIRADKMKWNVGSEVILEE